MNEAQRTMDLTPWWELAYQQPAWTHVWSVMLYPQDDQGRKNYLWSNYCAEGLHWLWTKPSVQEIEKVCQRLVDRGTIAGHVFQYIYRVEMAFREGQLERRRPSDRRLCEYGR